MSTLTEIEAAADSLSSDEKEELLRFLTMRLRKDRSTTPPVQTDPAEFAGALSLYV